MSPQAEEIVAGKYRLERHLARGGMGAVWRARHLELDVDVALKFLRNDTVQDERADARFRREARAAAQLKSPHVVHIYDFGSHDGNSYLAMELLDGVDLEQFLGEGGRLPLEEALTILEGAGRGLKAAHRAGLIHRDIKPSNLFVAREGGESVIKLLDFGIAKQLTPASVGSRSDPEDVSNESLRRAERQRSSETTAAGEVFGSPAYMSPEQARGGVVGAASDLWSLAAVFYRMLTGQSPFQGENSGDVVVKVCTEDPPLASSFSSEWGSEVDEFFRRALSRDPNQRFSEVDALLEAAFELSSVSRPAQRASSPGLDHNLPAVGRITETAPLRVVSTAQGSPEAVDDLSRRISPLLTESRSRSLPAGRRRNRILIGILLLVGAGFAAAFFFFGVDRFPPKSTLSESLKPGEEESKESIYRGESERHLSPPSLSPSSLPSSARDHADPPDAEVGGDRIRTTEPARTVSPNVTRQPPPASTSTRKPAAAKTSPLPAPATPPTDPIFGLPVEPP